ncbi:MAG: GatB/YqeY domain-containing protein [Bacillales bacterium]|nr:GatB/YqeY domain-containing protein [Bacillales bacterium]
MLIDEIKKAKMVAMREKDFDARKVYDVIVNKYLLLSIDLKEKGVTIQDSDMISIMMKTLKELADEKENYARAGRQDSVDSISRQEEVIRKYIPKMLNEDEIRSEIEKLEDKSIPSIMKHFKMNFQGKVEMSLVSKVAKTIK